MTNPIDPTADQLQRALAATAQVQVNPITVELSGCHVEVQDATINGQNLKQLLLVHQTGAIAYRIPLPFALAKQIGTALCAPRGVHIANGSAPEA